MTAASIGHGITFGIHDGADPGAFDLIGEVIDITPPPLTTDQVEATHFLSAGGVREYIPGLKTPGEGSLTINWVPGDASDLILQALLTSGSVRSHQVTFPNGTIWTFDGYVKGFAPSTPIGDRMTAVVTIQSSGATAIT
ncbi:MAG: hypothetical protein ACJA1L_000173 [Paracoccaceae bacterium]|jgi:hypothetical protein